MSDEDVCRFLSRLLPHDRFQVSFIDVETLSSRSVVRPEPTVWAGSLREFDSRTGRYVVRYDRDAPGVTRELPCDKSEYLVLSLTPLADVPPARADVSRLPDYTFKSHDVVANPDIIIYYDGGWERASRRASCAVVAKFFKPGEREPVVFEFTRLFVGGTNNTAEHLSLLGALRLAALARKGKFVDGVPIGNIAVIGDSQLTIQQALKIRSVKKPSLVNLVQLQRDIIGDLTIFAGGKTFVLYHVLRKYNSCADLAGRKAIASKAGHDPFNIFECDVSSFDTSPETEDVLNEDAAPAPEPDLTQSVDAGYSVAQLLHLRTFPTLTAVPLEAAAAWAQLVHGAIQAVLSCTAPDDTRAAFSRLLALPSLFLPAHLSIVKVCLLLHEKKPCLRKVPAVDRSAADRTTRNLRECVRYSQRGQLRKAIRSLMPAPLANIEDAATLATLKTKYLWVDQPFSSDPERDPATATLDNLPLIAPAVTFKALRKMNPVAASGLDRWNASLMLAAVGNNPDVLPALSLLVHRILSDWRVFESFCTEPRGVALAKNDVDVRPVGIAGFFFVLTAAICVRLDDPAKLLPAWQMGLAKNGCYRVIRDVRHRFNAGECVLTIDAENAHNSISRQACWDALQSRKAALPYTRAFFRLAYSSANNVHFQRLGTDWLTISTNVGVRQGCPSAGFVYNLASADALATVIAKFDVDVGIYAIHDDITICSPHPAHLASLFPLVAEALASCGLKVNVRKCEFLAPPPRPLAQRCAVPLPTLAATVGVPFVDGAVSSVRLLGAHVGADSTTVAYIRSKWETTKTLIGLVAHLGALQPRAAVALLRFCCQPQLLYRFTTHEPRLCEEIAREYDACVMDALRSFISKEIVRDLVVSSFGLGFADYPAALPCLYSKFLENSSDIAELKKADPLAEMRSSHDATLLIRFPLLKARLVALGASACGSASWLSPFIPQHFCAHHRDVIAFLRFLLLADPVSPPCLCGFVDSGDGRFLQHALTCSRPRGSTRTHRHNLMLIALDYQIKRFGVFTALEPRFYEYAEGKDFRPDLTCFTQPPVCTDLVVSADPEAALEAKIAKHASAVEQRGHVFIPIAVNIFGQLHHSVDVFLRKVLADLPPSTRKLAILQTKRAIAEAWLTGSAEIISGIEHVREHRLDDIELDLDNVFGGA